MTVLQRFDIVCFNRGYGSADRGLSELLLMRPNPIHVLKLRSDFARQMRSAALALAVATGSAVVPVSAQTASQITPPSFRPNQTRTGAGLIFSGQPGLGTPAGAEKLNVRLSGVAVENLSPGFVAEAKTLEGRLVSRRIAASEIFAAARDLEAAFVRSGAVLVRVVLPVQTLRDGNRLRLVVVNGFIERVDCRNLPEAIRTRVCSLVEPLVGQRDLKLGEIERRLLIAGDTPGVSLRSTLAPSASMRRRLPPPVDGPGRIG